MAQEAIGALANLATSTAADRGVVAALTEANARLTKQLEDNSNEEQCLKTAEPHHFLIHMKHP
jgi:hypothetical protein